MATAEDELKASPQPRGRILLFLGATLLLGFLFASAISILVFRDAIRASILDTGLPLSSDNIYSEIQRDLIRPILISSLMANDTFLKDWIDGGEIDEAAVRRYLARIQNVYSTDTAFFVSGKTRNYYHATKATRQVDQTNPNDRWFFRVAEMDAPYEINIDPDQANADRITIFINYRVLGADGTFLGAAGVGLGMTAVKALIQEYSDRYNRDVYFYDLEGNLVLQRFEEDPIDPDADPKLALGRDLADVVALAKDSSGPSSISRTTPTGRMANYRFIPELNWILVVEQKSDGTGPALFRSFALNMVICLITSAILLVVILRISNGYQRGLELQNRQLTKQNACIESQAAELAEANRQLDSLRKTAESASAAKSAFIANMSHEVRTPMNAVIGFAEILDHSLEDPTHREYAQIIGSSGRSLLALMEDILDLSKIEAGRIEARPTPVHLPSVISEIRSLFSAEAASKGISITTEISSTLDQSLLLDESRLRQILINLLSNAIKFTDLGVVEISATAEPAHSTPNCWKVDISVTDTGPGIPEDKKEQIFNTFEQLENSVGGSGLGLAISRRLATVLDGNLTVHDRADGPGSTFTLTLPEVPEASPVA